MKYWMLDGKGYEAKVSVGEKSVVLANSLVSRTIRFDGCRTVSYRNLPRGIELIDAAFPDFALSVNGRKTASDEGFVFEGAEVCAPKARVPFRRSATMTAKGPYPPRGRAVLLRFRFESPRLKVCVHYELYDGLPVLMKCVSVQNTGGKEIVIDNIFTEVLKIAKNREDRKSVV